MVHTGRRGPPRAAPSSAKARSAATAHSSGKEATSRATPGQTRHADKGWKPYELDICNSPKCK